LNRTVLKLFFALVLGLFVSATGWTSAAFAQAPVNPTAKSVKEEDLLKALKGGGDAVSGRITIPDAAAAKLIQPEGNSWRDFKQGTLPRIGAISVLGMIVVLAAFYAWRGKIKIDGGASSQRIMRFRPLDRFTHWVTATSFMVLGLTGLNVTFGRSVVLPIIGAEAFTSLSIFGKYLHNYLGFAFMAGLVLMFLIWVKDNIPASVDVAWFKAGGGILKGSHHPPAKRFNGGQKLIFWTVIIGGVFMSLSGWHLLFPNLTDGVQELQFHSMIHGVIAMLMIAVILAHIYIGSIGMEGAFDAMGRGDVDLNWAKSHHSLWVEDEIKKSKGKAVMSGGAAAE
jgi:formate dehydrogenase subunit gamma